MTDKITIDTLIHARWIAPVVPANSLYEDCAIAIKQGQIIDLLPSDQADNRYLANDRIELAEHLLTPGLINTHNHAAMSLLRGYSDDKPLMNWLQEDIWPAEQRFVDEQFVRDGTELAMAEMIRSGTSCFSDMYFFPEQAAQAATEAGMRAQITFPILDFPTNWAQNADDYFAKGLAFNDAFRSSELITVGFGPHAPYTVSDEPLRRIATLASEMNAPIQIHLHETAFEVEQSLNDHGMRPTERLDKLGLLSPLTQCVHMTQINERDIEILQATGAHVVHCPESNLKLASGFCPSHKLLEAGINVALGTDGAASNNDLNLLNEVRTASLLAKGVSQNAQALDANKSLEMATLNGAKALGLDNIIGSLEVGKQADICAFTMNELEQLPLYNPVSQLIYSASSNTVSHLWVNGKLLLNDRQLTTLNLSELKNKARRWAAQIAPSNG